MTNFEFNDREFTQTMVLWYIENARKLPWRETKDPYCIWLSEIMLQQTQVETVKPYYLSFFNELPTVKDLANAPIEQIYKLWEGLGYYRRASHLKEAACTIMNEFNGEFPNTYEQLITLKGIGAYTASAISSIAFGEAKGVVDGNILRIVSRLFNRQDNIAKDSTKKEYQQIMDYWTTLGNPSDFNQGMMDLGATVCTPKNPRCESCPVQSFCAAYKEGTQKLLPVNIKNTKKSELYFITAIIKCGDKYMIIKNKDSLLNDLYGLVQYEVLSPFAFEEQFYDDYQMPVRLLEYETEIKHVFSHRVWHMSVYYGEIDHPKLYEDHPDLYTWEEMQKLPIPTAHKKIFDKVKYY